jgi:phytoene synthase
MRRTWKENFPVAALLSPRFREPVLAFYWFARITDDIADHPDMPLERKLAELDAAERALTDDVDAPAYAARLRRALSHVGVGLSAACQIVQAHRLEASKFRYESWSDLLLRCRYSAASVGRFFLELHGEDSALTRSADALCIALQVLDDLQDCGDDYRRLGRIYIPRRWLDRGGCPESDLGASTLSDALRRVIDKVLDRVDELLKTARSLPSSIRDSRLRLHVVVAHIAAERLSAKLRGADPLRRHVRLSIWDWVLCLGRACWSSRQGFSDRTR